MKWSKIRKELHVRLADNLKKRLDYHLTTYKNSIGYLGRAWVTYDGKELVNFSNQDTWIEFKSYSNALADTGYISHEPLNDTDRTEGKIMERGEFSKYDFAETAWRFINLDIDSAISSENPILRSLAVVDRRIGKRRLEAMKDTETHPLVLGFMELRKERNTLPNIV
ncbi:hypothetical protein ACFSC6_00110 [Rufibacter sediminis]|uniref:Uncharacterized protein n=1 Tax=Rufibacter sediminis TaxID=2762756 RepID=A0ABR6VZ60_9BACT|nr:hypothetical protein [Rufibacter sediminis]MBC3542446.1 hypothetical protein [Rufibacter sediminis]